APGPVTAAISSSISCVPSLRSSGRRAHPARVETNSVLPSEAGTVQPIRMFEKAAVGRERVEPGGRRMVGAGVHGDAVGRIERPGEGVALPAAPERSPQRRLGGAGTHAGA